jgi:hypothetical protein
MLLSDQPITDDSVETSFESSPVGPSSRGCCKVTVGNSCGSGSLVGVRNGKSLILTNAHVAGTKIGSTARCTFPFADNKQVTARLIMAGYSDRVMMDWAILECDELINLPHTKLANVVPSGEHYTAGYPRCQGPRFQRLRTQQITHNGTVWRWQPNSIGGQSGSGVHSIDNNLQHGLLTWSWGGDGAGQTTRAIWFQYINQAEVGFPRPDGLIELCEVNPDVENGFFAESNITTLPIWAHLDDGNPTPPAPPSGDYAELIQRVQSVLDKVGKDLSHLSELLKDYKPPATPGTKPPADGGTFGL